MVRIASTSVHTLFGKNHTYLRSLFVPWIPELPSAHLFPHSSFPDQFPFQRTGSPFPNLGFGAQPFLFLRGSFPSIPCTPSKLPSRVLCWSLPIILETRSNFSLSYHQDQILFSTQHPLQLLPQLSLLLQMTFLQELPVSTISTSLLLPCFSTII